MPDATRAAPRQAEAERNDRALLAAARETLAVDGPHASVAAIAQRAGVGIGSLYRRYRTKEELFRHLCEVALDDYCAAAAEGLARDDPWDGLAHYLTASIEIGPGSLAPVAGRFTPSREMNRKNRQCEDALSQLVERARAAGVLRADVTPTDLNLLVEQLAKSPLPHELATRGRADLAAAARDARRRVVAIALDGLRTTEAPPLPGRPPGDELLTARWSARQSPSSVRRRLT